MKVSRVAEMRNLDRTAVEQFGIVEDLLMENAGDATYFTIFNEFGVRGKNFVIFCGSGNNGGDGLVVARKLHSNGAEVTVVLLSDRKKFKGPGKLNLEIAEKLPMRMIDLEEIGTARSEIERAEVIIDAMFGTGLARDVGGRYKDVIDLITDSHKTVCSLDIPSGIHGDTGQVMGTAVRADCTVTFGLPKVGNLLYPGFDFGGKLVVTHISFPPELYNSDELKIATNDPLLIAARDPDTHKGSYGKVLFVAGSSNYFGAPFFAALSFLKAGGGLSFLAAPDTMTPFIANKGSEIIMVPQKATETGSLSLENKNSLLEFSEQADMVVMGPGVSLNDETQQLLRELATDIQKPLLIDGDGITALANDLDIIKNRTHETILTPHPGEMSRITGQKISEIAKNKIDVLQSATEQLNAAIVLKGAHSLIGYPDQRIFINLSGNPGMATAGSGDVLTGAIAAMFGLGLPIDDAVRMGVFVHGFAGDLAADMLGEDGITAGDIMECLPEALKTSRDHYDEITSNHYDKIYVI
ncbi:NAD(P)H-hydrate dehydratase [candidate division KSB1 bacterium]|nr:NAD(P)H-hydrate dehydratase [candidate division KSB1 bacterium]NIR70585.1 NAD(P)H-hydrate dehydratase [candidate division KSB1 bacterium]NIS27721.1 NAD(P)H-hydrate dehydratase [candidate division KSB1 bacterium]NIT74549.1 NAD(P)H-hydrate dehydratase [candidate division KSB1 bacterium]NIU28374.1 NAD(P)H-hydrate dehydratase [candidate division KSB1 bacterium]